jgi:hypothetical protein
MPIQYHALHACFCFGYFVTTRCMFKHDRVFRFNGFCAFSRYGGNDREPDTLSDLLYLGFYVPDSQCVFDDLHCLY